MSITDLTNNSLEEHIISFYYNEIAKSIKSKEEFKTILVPHLGKFVYKHRKHYKLKQNNEKRLKGVE